MFLFSGCKNSENKSKYCNQLEVLAINEVKKGNINPYLKGKHLYSSTEKYFVWKKYGININYPLDNIDIYLKELDSCYNNIMLKSTINKDKIVKDLDSLTSNKVFNNVSNSDFRFYQKYHDGLYDIFKIKKNEKFLPKRIDTLYFNKLENFKISSNSTLEDTLFCEFWYEIDTLGHVNNIEIFQHINPTLDTALLNFYKSFKYLPANNGKSKIEFRGIERIYF